MSRQNVDNHNYMTPDDRVEFNKNTTPTARKLVILLRYQGRRGGRRTLKRRSTRYTSG